MSNITVLAIFLVMEAVNTWNVFKMLAVIIIPLLSAIVSAFYWMHNRVTEIKESSTLADGAIYGVEGDPLQMGLAKEVDKMKTEIEEIEDSINELNYKVDRLEQRNDKD